MRGWPIIDHVCPSGSSRLTQHNRERDDTYEPHQDDEECARSSIGDQPGQVPLHP